MELILDTNIYRNLVRNLSEEEINTLTSTIKTQCEHKNITLLFPVNSAMELIAHYNDQHEGERRECRNALNMLVSLSSTYSSTHIHVDFVPPLNAIFERYVFAKEDTHAKMYSKVITVAQMLTGNIQQEVAEAMEGYINAVKDQIEFEKKEIRDNYEEYIKSINNGSADWTYFNDKNNKKIREEFFKKLRNGTYSFFVAQSFLDRAYNITGQQIVKDQEYLNKIIKFMQDFCPALLMNELLLEKVGHGVGAIKDVGDGRWNTVIDISLIFGALYNPHKKDKRLVTEENNIIAAFEQCGYQDKIMNLADFKAKVGI
jgi:hypothetical protein